MTETAMAVAFARNGVTEADAAFRVALARYLNTGGTVERARAMLDDAAARMPAQAGAGGQCIDAGNGHRSAASSTDPGACAKQPQGHDRHAPGSAGEANLPAPQGHFLGASPAETISHEAHRDTRGRFVPHPNAVRGMSREDRRALVSVKTELAKTQLATKVGEFNCLLRDLSWDQVAAAGERNTARGLFFAGLWTMKAEGARKVGDCVTDDDLRPLVAMAERKAQLAFARLMAG